MEMLKTRLKRVQGAMFGRNLGDRVLVFVYKKDYLHWFHTAFCSTLRIVAYSRAGEVCFDQVIPPWRIVRIPPACWVVECSPEYSLNLGALFNTFQGEK
jgi:hypothetical protein